MFEHPLTTFWKKQNESLTLAPQHFMKSKYFDLRLLDMKDLSFSFDLRYSLSCYMKFHIIVVCNFFKVTQKMHTFVSASSIQLITSFSSIWWWADYALNFKSEVGITHRESWIQTTLIQSQFIELTAMSYFFHDF